MFITILEEMILESCLGDEVWVYDFFVIGFSIFLKNFEISLTSFNDLDRIRDGIDETKIGLAISLSLFRA